MDKRRLLITSITIILAILPLLSACKRPPLPPPLVLFDQSHGQQSQVDNIRLVDLSKFAALFREQGFEVAVNRKPFTDEILQNIDALIISGPSAPLTTKELKSLTTYLYNGGQLCLMLNVAAPTTNLLRELRVAVANKPVHERKNTLPGNDLRFSLDGFPQHPLTQSLSTFIMDGAWPLNTALEANVIAKTSNKAWVDLDGDHRLGRNDASQSFAVVDTGQLGHGHFVIFGDDALFTNRFLTESNLRLGKNLAAWFKTGSYY